MQDVRIRVGAAAILSLVAYLSLIGAGLVFAWWLIATPRFATVRSLRTLIPIFVLIGFFSLILELTQGGGISYFLRMSIIILVGLWLLYEQKPGEMLALSVWLLGNRWGFELGLIAEMGLQSFELLQSDIERIRIAEKLKGIPWSMKNIVPTGVVLVRCALVRAEDTAELLAVRGFFRGGSLCPVFTTTPRDVVAGFGVICIGVISYVPVSEFFILYR